jgi:F0F1-type ATP synthase assembly protein I
VTAERAPLADHGISNVRRLAARILGMQVAATLSIALVAYFASGSAAAASALAGGGIGVVANFFMAMQSLRPAASAGQALGRMMLGQGAKVFMTLAGFLALARTPDVVWVLAIVSYLATIVVFWLVPVMTARRLPPRSLGSAGGS